MDSFSEIADKLRPLVAEIEREEGAFTLAALVERESNYGRYYFVVSAPWFRRPDRAPWSGESRLPKIGYFTQRVGARLTDAEATLLAATLLLDPEEEFVRAVTRFAGEVSGGGVEFGCREFAEMDFRRGLVMESHPATRLEVSAA